MNKRIGTVIDRWVAFSLRRPKSILFAATLFFALAALTASRLELRSDFVELLPTDAPSVVNLEAMKQRVSSYATLVVAAEGPDLDASMRFAEDLVARLRPLQPDRIRFIDYNLKELSDFYARNKLLYADLDDLSGFRDRLEKRIREETRDAMFESLDEIPAPRTDLRIDEMREKYEKKAREQDRYPGGYYVTPDRTILAVFIRPPSKSSGFRENERLVNEVQSIIDDLDPGRYHPEMVVGMTGDVKTGLEERDSLADDMLFISSLCLFLILALIVIYYRSFRAVILIGVPMLIGLASALAIARLQIGYLNAATAFLVSIIAGNGINFMIILAARFFEETRNRGADSLDESLRLAVRGTMFSTVIAAAAAAISYGSLGLASFRGFRQFGLIGGIGMLLCWIATFAVGPALITYLHRRKPLAVRIENQNHPVASFVARFVLARPRTILVVSLLMTSAAILVTIPYVFDPFEYDFRNLRNREGYVRGSAKLSNKVDKIFDLPQSPTPIVADRVEVVPEVKQAFLDAPSSRTIIGDVKTLFDFLPKQQDQKLAVLADIRTMIDRRIDFLPADERKTVEDYRPGDDLRVLGLDDVPEVVARPYTEIDGTRGRVLYVYAAPGNSLLNGRYLLKFAEFVRSVKLDGVELIESGQPMVFADMIQAILADGLWVTFASVVGVTILLLVAFRSALGTFSVMGAILMGTLWMIGLAAAFDIKLNFLNFVVLPITVGISVDYGANIFLRYRQEGPGSIEAVIRSTGGAVFLASLTTIIGYATLITSTNMALQTFGLLADLGELATILVVEVVMTALLVWIERGRRARKAR
jgi:hypothetical protein